MDKDQKFWLLFWTIVATYFIATEALRIIGKYFESLN